MQSRACWMDQHQFIAFHHILQWNGSCSRCHETINTRKHLKQIEGRCIPGLLSKRICFFFCRAFSSPRTEKLLTYKNLKSAGKKQPVSQLCLACGYPNFLRGVFSRFSQSVSQSVNQSINQSIKIYCIHRSIKPSIQRMESLWCGPCTWNLS